MTWFYHVFFYDIAVEDSHDWPWSFIRIVTIEWPGSVLVEHSICCFIVLSLVNKKKHRLRAIVVVYVSLAL